jgi:hypothetical protein
VKFTVVPAQIVLVEAAIAIDGTTIGFTVIVIEDDVTVATVAQASLEVNDTAI